MSDKSDKTAARSSRGSGEKKNRALFYTLLFFLLIAAAAALIGIGGHFLRKAVLTDNPRLAVRQVTVKSTGFWSGKEKELSRRLGVKCCDADSPDTGCGLFTLDPAELRQKLLKFPGIKTCEVRRIPPDTLDFRIIERLPRAALGSPRSEWVVDEEGILFPRSEAIPQESKMTLPAIIGYRPKQKLVIGKPCPGLENSLELILLTVRNFPDLEILAIDLSRVANDKQITLFVRYRKMRECQAILPAGDRNYSFRLSELQSAILYAEQRGDGRRIFDLSFEGSAIIR